MANYCSIHTYIPLKSVPDEQERNYLEALYKAEQAYKKAVRKDSNLSRGKNRDEFIASQPGVPSKLTRWSTFGTYYKGREGEKLKPKSKQWRMPIVGANFTEYNKHPYVSVYYIKDNNGITIRPFKSKFQITHLEMSKDYRNGYPWWVEICFADGVKYCDEESTEEDMEKAMKAGEFLHPYLLWETTLEKALENLEYAIDVYSRLPIHGFWYNHRTFFSQMNKIEKFYRWLKSTCVLFPEAFIVMDYAEVNMMISFEDARKDDSPNKTLQAVRDTERDINKLSLDKLQEKYKEKEFVPFRDRNPFEAIQW